MHAREPAPQRRTRMRSYVSALALLEELCERESEGIVTIMNGAVLRRCPYSPMIGIVCRDQMVVYRAQNIVIVDGSNAIVACQHSIVLTVHNISCSKTIVIVCHVTEHITLSHSM